MAREIQATTRTALFGGGRVERVYETFVETGPFAGCMYEVLESELTAAEAATAAAVRSSVERGDPLAIMRGERS